METRPGIALRPIQDSYFRACWPIPGAELDGKTGTASGIADRRSHSHMDRLRALEILALLADGVDPYTGEQYPIDSPYQHPDTVRALYAAIAGLDRPVAPVKKSAKVESTESGPEKAGKPWSADEDELLRGEAGQALDLKLIADTHGRTPGAISARLVRLGLFPDRETARTALTR